MIYIFQRMPDPSNKQGNHTHYSNDHISMSECVICHVPSDDGQASLTTNHDF